MITKPPSPLLLILLLQLLKLIQSGFQIHQNEHSITRANYQQSAIPERKIPLITIRPHITYSDYIVTIDASIGTPSERKTFILDTATSLTWIQCSPCKHCFHQTLPLFDPKRSTSYKQMSTTHPLSHLYNTSTNGSIVYLEKFLANQTSQGMVSLETFSFPSNVKGVRKIIDNIVFGCANNNLGNWPYNNTPITGIMGLDRSLVSLINQVVVKPMQCFSYCLPKLTSRIKTTYLRFGSDVPNRQDFVTTSLKNNTNKYVVNLQGISVAGRRVKLSKPMLSNGCLISTGFPGNVLETRVYINVVRMLAQHFDRFKLERLYDPSYQGKLCYRTPSGFKSFPNMTFHFKGSGFWRAADFQIRPENLFAHRGDVHCMMVYKHENLTILGAFQMQNVRFIFDLQSSKLTFGTEDCSKDRANLGENYKCDKERIKLILSA